MGCNLKLRVWCKSNQLPGQRLLDLVNHLGESPLFGRIFRVEVKKSPHYFKGDYITFEQLDEKGLPRNEITRIVEQYINQPVTFEAWWETRVSASQTLLTTRGGVFTRVGQRSG